jgi:hypothetical protein
MLDAQLLLSNAQTLHSTTAASTNIIDLLTLRDIGVGNMIEVNVVVTEAAVSAGGATLQVVLQTSPTAGGAGTYYDIMMTAVMAVADLPVGRSLFKSPLPRLYQNNEQSHGQPQYLRLNYVIGTSTFSALAVTAYLSAGLDRESYFTYPNNYTV